MGGIRHCEDAAILYISLMEAIDYDAMLGVGLVLGLIGADMHDCKNLGTYWWGLEQETDLILLC